MKYWIEIAVFTAIACVLILLIAPELSWINTDSDGAHYLMSAKYITVAHHLSAPLYILLGHLFLYLPFGTEAWRLGLMSALGTIGTVVFVYLIVRKLSNRYYGMMSALIYGGSALVISQSTIIETYTLSTMCGVGAYYFALNKRWAWASVFLGIGLVIHPFLSFIVWVVLFIMYKEMRNWRRYSITIAFFIFYLYIPIVGHIHPEGNIWGNTTTGGFFGGALGLITMLSGGLSVWDLPKRILDTIGILAVSLGLGIIITVWHLIKTRTWRYGLLWLFLIPIIYFTTNLSAETYVYLLPSIAFGSVITGVALSKMNIKWLYATSAVAVALLAFNVNYFDIGRTLDPNLSAHKFYTEELPKLKDGDILLAGGWTWAIGFLYNKEENRDITPICIDILPSNKYLDQIESNGIKVERTTSERHVDKQWENALSIAQLNDNVWIVKEIHPSSYEYEIVPAKNNLDLITRWLGYEVPAEFRWKPSNPYLFIVGGLEVTEWKFVLKSNHNCLFLAFGIGFIILIFRKKKVNAQSNA